MADVTLVIDAETAKAMRELAKFAQEQRKVEDNSDQMTRKSRKASDEVGFFGTQVGRATAAIGGMVAAGLSVNKVIDLVTQLDEKLGNVKQSSDAAANALLPLAVQVAGKEGGDFVRKTAIAGARAGLSPEETGKIANTIKSIQGSDFEKDFATAALLRNLGVKGEDAAPIIQAGITRGLGSQRAADLAVAASDLAPWDPATVARVIPKTLGFSSLESALSGAAMLKTAGVVDEQLPASTEALSRALSKNESELAKRFKLKGLGEGERIERLAQLARDSGDEAEFLRRLPERAKLGEEEGRALRAVLSTQLRGDATFGEFEGVLRGTQPGAAQRRLDLAMQENPAMRAEMESRIARETFAAAQIYGPLGAQAREHEARKQALGMQMQRDFPGVAKFLTSDTGEVGLTGRALMPFLQAWNTQRDAWRSVFGGISRQEFVENERRRLSPYLDPVQAQRQEIEAVSDATLKDLTEALKENTEATRANSEATGTAESGATPIRNAGIE